MTLKQWDKSCFECNATQSTSAKFQIPAFGALVSFFDWLGSLASEDQLCTTYCVLLCATVCKLCETLNHCVHTVSNALLIECLQLTISYSQWAHSSSTHSKTTEHTVNCVLFTVCLRSKLCYSTVDRLVSVTIIFKYLKVILSTLDLTNCLQNHTINRRPESRPHPMSMSMSMSTLK
jgi:hypothetical protein